MEKEPKVQVGILSARQIEFTLSSLFQQRGKRRNDVVTYSNYVRDKQVVTLDEGQILWEGTHFDSLEFLPMDEAADSFELQDVTIGINFHWERKENQRFRGALKIIIERNMLTAVNVISVEDYLTSVISSEMSATASVELLKAHAVISRSWLLANLKETDSFLRPDSTNIYRYPATKDDTLKWYERDNHTRYDVCADDHCQRYQGITRASTDKVKQAIAATRGQVLMYNDRICDARFSKCCGGMFEEFQYCWDNIRYPYLKGARDKEQETKNEGAGIDLAQESEADHWIRTSPESFCNTTDKRILSQVLNNYDQETVDFYRWKVKYTQAELSALIRERSGTDYGDIIDLIPVARGTSGRLWKLKIVGTKQTHIIGKELEIRRTLSPTHLYSSAFVVDKEGTGNIPERFILTGAGWGHGVGLCQIGAAVMGERGYSYDQILLHYYIGADILRIYE